MRVLLDTNVLLWAVGWSARLDVATYEIVQAAHEVSFSAASIWEIAVRAGLRRADFNADPAKIAAAAIRAGFTELPVRSDAAALVATLPPLHRDPFDRLLIAQAMVEPARLLTADAMLARYSELVTVVEPRAV